MKQYCMYCLQTIAESDEECPFCGKSLNYECPAHHLVPGTILDNHFLIGAALGQGGFGITYIGKDLNLDIKVAIKEYYPNGFVNRSATISPNVTCNMSQGEKDFFEKGREGFLNEARILAKFSKEPGIVEVRHFFEENDTAYIVMEYVEGQDLSEHLKEEGTFSPEEIHGLMLPVLRALAKVHEKGLIHRDISPDNIRFSEGKLKLLDFGAARMSSAVANKTISVILKPGYAPEEQYRSKGKQGAWTDVYALCATMYKCITGITPDDSPDRKDSDEVKVPSALGIPISATFEHALMKGMSVRQEDRYQSIKALMDGLNGIEASEKEGLTIKEEVRPLVETGDKINAASNSEQAQVNGNKCEEDDKETVYAGEGVMKPEEPKKEEKTSGKKKWWLLLLVLILLMLLIGGGIWVLARGNNGGKDNDPGTIATETPEPTTTSAPTIAPILTPTSAPTDSPTPTLSPMPTPTQADTPTPTLTNTPTPTNTPSPTPTNTPSPTLAPTLTPTPTWTAWTTDASLASNEQYDVETEERVVYRYRDMQTVTGSSSSMPGWTLDEDKTVWEWSEYGEWSDWSTTKASNSDSKSVDTKTQYRYRDMLTTTGNSSTKSGWTLDEDKTTWEWSAYGNWSSWSTTEMTETQTREVDTKTEYRYREKQTATSSSDTMTGWILDNSKTTFTWSEYGNWSSWSTTAVSASDTKIVEKKTQYSYRDKQYTTGNSSTLPEWTLYNTTSAWGEWSPWSTSVVYETSDRDVETQVVNIDTTAKEYRYRRCVWYSSSGVWSSSALPPSGYTEGSPSVGNKKYRWSYTDWMSEPVEGVWISDWNSYKYRVNETTYYTEQTRDVSSTIQQTQYRYRDKIYTYHFWKWGSWSSWSDTMATASDTREVNTQTVYRYATRSKVYTYHFYRWSDWSDWSDSFVTASETREVDNRTVYRYRTRNKIYTYHFWKWDDWSSWSDTSITESDIRDVDKRTLYRYKTREKLYTYHFYKWSDWSEWSEKVVASSDVRDVDVKTVTYYRYRLK